MLFNEANDQFRVSPTRRLSRRASNVVEDQFPCHNNWPLITGATGQNVYLVEMIGSQMEHRSMLRGNLALEIQDVAADGVTRANTVRERIAAAARADIAIHNRKKAYE